MSAFTIRKLVRDAIKLFIPTIIVECKKNVAFLEDRIYRKMFPDYILRRNTISGIINILRFSVFIKEACATIRRIISN